MESKRLGLCSKSMFVVPNHLIGQWSADILRLYPNAKVLAATKKDFEPANRKRFCFVFPVRDVCPAVLVTPAPDAETRALFPGFRKAENLRVCGAFFSCR